MVILPLHQKLKKKLHKTIALAQDILIMKMYDKFPSAVVHGGTAIWRCYGSNRFSEDVDVYLQLKDKNKERLEDFFEILKSQGLLIKKFKMTNNTLFSKISYGKVEIRFEAAFKNINHPAVKPFELTDGSFINVLTFSPEDLILEKILAYKKRKKIRDLYDIHFLLKFVTNRKKIEENLKEFIKTIEKPVDEKELPTLIISGVAPDVNSIIRRIATWVR
jgi:predicted nucleotidyltransferase component of viral defense system